jgi:hypothetical protein
MGLDGFGWMVGSKKASISQELDIFLTGRRAAEAFLNIHSQGSSNAKAQKKNQQQGSGLRFTFCGNQAQPPNFFFVYFS